MAKDKNFYITTAISYVNGSPHLGHAYEAILTDVIARFKRLDGYDTYFLTGTDEHGEKVATTAEKNNMDPKEFCDKISAEFVSLTNDLNISNDMFIRTTEPHHYEAAQAIWKQIKQNNPEDIYLGKYEGWYSVRDEGYFSDDELATADDGKKYAPSGAEVTWKEESSYFFKLSAYTDKLLELYENHPEFIEPESRRNEIISFVKQGLRDISISRTSFNWGVPVPDDKDHVMYVWLDALTNYITALGYPDTDSDNFKNYWPADVHVIGKDITRFHAVYWPAFLLSAGLELPKTIFAHGFINIEGQKMSKSLGNVLSPHQLVNDFGLDQTRYILMREVPHGQDGNFSHEHAIQRINSDLANGLGNLAQRTLSMIYKNCDMKIPEPSSITEEDQNLLVSSQSVLITEVRDHFDKYLVHRALEAIINVASKADIYIDAQAPWKLKKDDPKRMNTVLYVLAETIRCLAISMLPVTPDAANKILDQLSVPDSSRVFMNLRPAYALEPGTLISKPTGVFTRIQIEDNDLQEATA